MTRAQPDNPLKSAFDNPDNLVRYLKDGTNGRKEIVLSVDGISCAGCVSKIESAIQRIPGADAIQVNPATHRAVVSFFPEKLDVPSLLEGFELAGYPATPYEVRDTEKRIQVEWRKSLIRIMLAGALGMQVMMIATALYFGDAMGMDPGIRKTLEFVAMILTIPILVFSARPFFDNAWKAFHNSSISVDVPVTLALLVAFTGSVLATLGYPGQVYYESIAMFVFLLLLARFLELGARRRSLAMVISRERSLPEIALRIDDKGSSDYLDVNHLQIGDRVLVGPGELIPTDGTVIDGTTTVDESVLTGESIPLRKENGDSVIAGSMNIENTLEIRVTHLSDDNVLSRILHLTERAQSDKTKTARLADRIAGKFVAGVLLLAIGAVVFWWFRDRSLILPVLISTLVIACPCALSLATPSVFVAAMGALTRRGIIPINGGFLDRIPEIDHIVFDKTGTLTMGNPVIRQIQTSGEWDDDCAAAIAATLNAGSRHPVARALESLADPGIKAKQVIHSPGLGVTGTVQDERYALGKLSFVREAFPGLKLPTEWQNAESPYSVSYLVGESGPVAYFQFEDRLRPEAVTVVNELKERGYTISILSGDNPAVVASTASALEIEDFRGAASPDEKQDQLRVLQASGKTVAVVGDGLNDAPAIASAGVSMAMGDSAELTRTSADVVLINNRLRDIFDVIDIGGRSRFVIRQNFAWAIGYNMLAIPAAIAGLVPPWLAAIGMSVSSLIVVSNASRLLSRKSKSPTIPGDKVATQAEFA